MLRFPGTSRPRTWLCRVALMVLLAVALTPAEVDADCADIDLLCQINALDSQLGITNGIVSGLNTAMAGLSSQMTAMQTAMAAIATTFDALTEDLLRVVGTFNAAMQSVASDTLTMTNDIVARVEDGRRLFEFLLAHERDRYIAFVGATGCGVTCEAFRGEILALIGHVESTTTLGSRAALSRLLFETDLPPPPVPNLDLSLMKEFLENTPGVVLYALYRSFPAITVEGAPPAGISSCEQGDPTCALAVLNGIFNQVEEAFEIVIELAEASRQGSAGTVSAFLTSSSTLEHQGCLFLMGQSSEGFPIKVIAEWAGSVLTALGGILKAGGYALESLTLWGLSETVTEVGVSVAVQATFGMHTNIPRWIARILKVVGAITAELGQSLLKRVAECREQLNQDIIICWLNENNPKKDNNNRESTYQWCVDQVRMGVSFR